MYCRKLETLVALGLISVSGMVGCSKQASPNTTSTEPSGTEVTTPHQSSSMIGGSQKTPSNATTQIAHTPDEVDRAETAEQLFEEITPETAERVLARLKQDPAVWNTTSGPFFREWGKVDPAAAIANAQTEPGRKAIGFSAMVVEGWAAESPEAARDWIDEQNDGWAKSLFAQRLVRATAENDIQNTATWATTFADRPYGEMIISRVASTWMEFDPRGAASWVDSLPDGKAQTEATRSLFLSWGRRDATEAGNFLSYMNDGPDRDVAVSSYAIGIATEHPDSAQEWAGYINDEALRSKTLQSLALAANPEPIFPEG